MKIYVVILSLLDMIMGDHGFPGDIVYFIKRLLGLFTISKSNNQGLCIRVCIQALIIVGANGDFGDFSNFQSATASSPTTGR